MRPRRQTEFRNQNVRDAHVKTHDAFGLWCKRILGAPPPGSLGENPVAAFANCKFIYLYRSPEDVLVSYFHLQRKVDYVAKSRFGIDEFCRSQLPHWIDNVGGYLKASESGVYVHFVSYEGMLQNPAASLAGVLRALEIQHDARIVQQAVDHMQFDKIRAHLEKNRPGLSEYGMRRGGSGAALEELQPQTRCEIREATSHLLKRVSKCVSRQTANKSGAAPVTQTAVANQPNRFQHAT